MTSPVFELDATIAGDVLICSVADKVVHAMLCRAGGAGKPSHVTWHTLQDESQVRGVLKQAGASCPVILVLPRSRYLVKELTLPAVADDEIVGMVALEAEAAAPPGMDEIEVAYRKVGELPDGQIRYEIFIARRSALADVLAQADDLKLLCDRVIPNTVLIEQLLLLARDQCPPVLVYESQPGVLELAALNINGHVMARSVGPSVQAQTCLPQLIGELVRSGQIVSEPDGASAVGWLGPVPKWCGQSSDSMWLKHRPVTLAGASRPSDASCGSDGVAVYLMALGQAYLYAGKSGRPFKTVELMPQARRQAKFMARAVESAVWACGGVVVAMLLVSLALWLLAGRYTQYRDALVDQVGAIEKEGVEVQLQVEQLEAMHATWGRRNLMRDVLTALYDATPEGVTYRQVDVKEDGVCHLRGQAQSMALPFELPELLEKQAIFTDILMVDVGQEKRGAGSVVQFRIDCRVVDEVDQ